MTSSPAVAGRDGATRAGAGPHPGGRDGGGGPRRDVRAATQWLRARELAHAAALPAGVLHLPLERAAGHTLAEPLVARTPLPAFDTAAMDGFAVCGTGPYRVVGRVTPGQVHASTLRAGEAVEISTGAPVPAGATAVLPIEQARVEGGAVLGATPAPGRHIRRTGEDVRAGVLLAPAGALVGPALVGLAAAAGHDELAVAPRPAVAVLVTGDELVHSGGSGGGALRDALGPMLPSLVQELGGEVVAVRHVPDRPAEALDRAVHDAAAGGAAVVVVTGSTSVGRTDRLRDALDENGARWIVDTVACRPGHPQLLARWGERCAVVGLPGNPFAAFVAAHTLLGPLLAGLCGRPLPPLQQATARGAVPDALPARAQLVPVRRTADGVEVIGGYRSASLRGAALADALAVVLPGHEPGAPVPLVPLRP